MTELADRLQATLGDAYRVERELGGGGMSHVFLAVETRLGRKVVIKVLPPEMAAGVNSERFNREIQLAASLQHPHIVPLITTGQAGDLLYYTMPLVEGESLRAKLSREGELPVGETVRILLDVVDALGYAHAHGVVHRDIKPDNVLISGHHAVVTDFGVAKAVSASSGSSTLTSLGVALGTPAYMAPEQAAADPHVDHRADLYAVGAMAYEMLCGRPPFTGMTPQAQLAAHVTQAPDPVVAHRPTVPPALNALVMRCLEKKPADRPQKAEELLAEFQAMATPSGGMAPTGATATVSSGTEAAVRRAHPARVAAAFVAVSAVVLALVYLAMVKVGLPGWVFGGAVALLAVGLPIMLVTGLFERRRAVARTTGVMAAPPPAGVLGLFTWRRAISGGGVAFGALGVGTAVYMAMRALGIGPVGTLVAAGTLKERQKVILSEFVNRAADTTLGPTLTEAFRVDLAQSPTVQLVDASAIGAALTRMQRDPRAHLTPDLARDVAERENVTAVVSGEIDPVGGGYVLSTSIVSASDGRVLTAVRATASDGAHLIEALDRLSGSLRERIGESFRTIRATPPLAQVTTGSLEALRKYSEAVRLFDRGDQEQAIPLLREATALDTGFAMAYRKLSVALENTGSAADQVVAAATQAFHHGDRLTDLERDLTAARYYQIVEWDPARVAAAYRSVLESDPTSDVALNNLADLLVLQGQYAAADSLVQRGIALGYGVSYYQTAFASEMFQGHFADAATTVERYAKAWPNDLGAVDRRAALAAGQHDYATAESNWRRVLGGSPPGTSWHEAASWSLYALAEVRGQLGQSALHLRDVQADAERRRQPADDIEAALSAAWQDLHYRNRPDDAVAKVAAALARHPLSGMPPATRPYVDLAGFYAYAGRVSEAQRLMAEFERVVPEGLRRGTFGRHFAAAEIAAAQGHSAEAVAELSALRQESGCVTCLLLDIGRLREKMNQPDSALAAYDTLVMRSSPNRVFDDTYQLAPVYRRLGELYEAKGDRARALDYYGRFVELWKNADPELQPAVREVRQRLSRLGAAH